MRSIQSLFAKIFTIFNTQEDIPEFKYPKTEFKPLTRELCNELKIIPLFRIPPDSKYINDPEIKKKADIADKKDRTIFSTIEEICNLSIKKSESIDDKERQALEIQINNLSQKKEKLNQELDPMEIELCNLLRKEAHERLGTCLSSNVHGMYSKIIDSSHIDWISDQSVLGLEWLYKLENLVGYPKEHAYLYENNY